MYKAPLAEFCLRIHWSKQCGRLLAVQRSILVLLIVLNCILNCSLGSPSTLSLLPKSTPQSCIEVDRSNYQYDEHTVSAELTLKNTSGTWVYVEQATASDSKTPVHLPNGGIYLLGPGGEENLGRITFQERSYLEFAAITPIGAFASDDSNLIALRGAFIVDLLTRGLLTLAFDPNVFDNPLDSAPDAAVALVQSFIDQLEYAGAPLVDLINDLQDGGYLKYFEVANDLVGVAIALAEVSDDLQRDFRVLLEKAMTPENADLFFSKLGDKVALLAEVLDLIKKTSLLADLTSSTLLAQASSSYRLDVLLPRSLRPPTGLTAQAVSQNQINLKWNEDEPNVSTYDVERSSNYSGPWISIGSSAQTSFSDIGRSPGAVYFYRVSAHASSLSSDPSMVASSSTLPVLTQTHQLLLTSSNPMSGVAIFVDNDQSGRGGGATPLNPFVYKAGTAVSVAASANAGNNSGFIKWQRDGVDYPSNGPIARVTMDSDHTMTAVYGTFGVARNLASLSVQGPSSIPETTSHQFTATAFYSDGSSRQVAATWSIIGSAPASVASASGVVNAGAVSADAGILVQAAYADGTGSVAASKSVTIKNTATIQTYTLTVNYDHALGSVSSSAVNSSIAAGTTVQLYAGTTSQSHFVDWGGDASGPSQAISVMMNGNKTVNANFASGNTDFGTLKVNILPAEAAAAGVTWGFSPTDFRVSGSTYSTWPASYWIALHTVDGWLGPNQQLMTITKGGSSTVSVTFTKDTTPGTLSVALTPPSAVAAGAKFTVNGATYGDGANVSLLPGTYNVTFAAATGWSTPPSQTVTVNRSQTTVATGAYTPPLGQPSISSVSPPVGALAGGTVLKIYGANFPLSATVTVGGVTAKNVTVVSSSEITCVVPASSAYGTAAVTVVTGSGNATNSKGFSYGIPRGHGIELVGSIGGYTGAVAAQGSYCYAGEGSTFLVLNIANPSAPAAVARLALPGLIQEIALFTASGKRYAAVADLDAGVQIVDITDPSAPALRGYYDTGDNALGIACYGGYVYVANSGSGLAVLSLANPLRPTLAGSLVFPTGYTDKVVIQPRNTTVFAYVATGGALAMVDVTAPAAPVLRGSTPSLSDAYQSHSIAINGNEVFLAAGPINGGGMISIDTSNPASPALIERSIASDSGFVTAVSINSGKVYTWGMSGLADYSISGNNLTNPNNVVSGFPFGTTVSSSNCMTIIGNTAICGSGNG
ncbi:MAG TPA: IPT/TIG domain-containing protein, partial [Chthoniobacteraceae bacterium]|nr:IPT/TIG domain-containing protein [Chthoniobacteraceae bacterium]